MNDDRGIEERLKTFLLEEFMAGQPPGALGHETPLITSGILDSVGTLTLIAFLEEQFSITVQAHEASVDNLNTVSAMARFVRAKRPR